MKFGATIIPFAAVGAEDSAQVVLDRTDLMAAPLLGDLLRRQQDNIVRVGGARRGGAGRAAGPGGGAGCRGAGRAGRAGSNGFGVLGNFEVGDWGWEGLAEGAGAGAARRAGARRAAGVEAMTGGDWWGGG